MESTHTKINISGGFLTTGLTLLFVAGKIFGYLDWSWWLVFLPIYIGLIIILIILFISLIAWGIVYYIDNWR